MSIYCLYIKRWYSRCNLFHVEYVLFHMKKLIPFVAVFVILATLAIVTDGRLFGYRFGEKQDSVRSVTAVSDGVVVNTTNLAADVSGYAGTVPVEIFISNGRVDSVRALPNRETPTFFGKLETSGLTHAWDGRSLQDALTMQVDAVSGATYSSTAYIANVRAGLESAIADSNIAAHQELGFSWKLAVVIFVILAGALLPLFIHNGTYRFVQQLLNVAVLGFWGGTFIDYAMLINLFSNGVHLSLAAIVTVLLFVVGFLFPLFGKSGHYCAWICPFGSLQDLAGCIVKKKARIGQRTLKVLDYVRQILWVVLIMLLYAGIGAEWIDYEIFTGFIVDSASRIVLCVGGAFVILSIFVSRPFCRFVCPTGSLLKQL